MAHPLDSRIHGQLKPLKIHKREDSVYEEQWVFHFIKFFVKYISLKHLDKFTSWTLTFIVPLLSLSRVLKAPEWGEKIDNTTFSFLSQVPNHCYQTETSREKVYLRNASVKLTAHGIQPHKAADVVIKIHVTIFITISANDHVEELVIKGEAWGRKSQKTIPLCY